MICIKYDVGNVPQIIPKFVALFFFFGNSKLQRREMALIMGEKIMGNLFQLAFLLKRTWYSPSFLPLFFPSLFPFSSFFQTWFSKIDPPLLQWSMCIIFSESTECLLVTNGVLSPGHVCHPGTSSCAVASSVVLDTLRRHPEQSPRWAAPATQRTFFRAVWPCASPRPRDGKRKLSGSFRDQWHHRDTQGPAQPLPHLTWLHPFIHESTNTVFSHRYVSHVMETLESVGGAWGRGGEILSRHALRFIILCPFIQLVPPWPNTPGGLPRVEHCAEWQHHPSEYNFLFILFSYKCMLLNQKKKKNPQNEACSLWNKNGYS